MRFKRSIILISIILTLVIVGFLTSKKINLNPIYNVGQKIDTLQGVYVYYNGGVGNIEGREVTKDGYNLGLRYQCVEFVKRYYYEAFQHKMPYSYGHAKDFFNPTVKDGNTNKQRDLYQYTNPSTFKPKVNDLVVYSQTLLNPYGHVSIISRVTDTEVEIIQQNSGPFGNSREVYLLENKHGTWRVDNNRVLGWLRK